MNQLQSVLYLQVYVFFLYGSLKIFIYEDVGGWVGVNTILSFLMTIALSFFDSRRLWSVKRAVWGIIYMVILATISMLELRDSNVKNFASPFVIQVVSLFALYIFYKLFFQILHGIFVPMEVIRKRIKNFKLKILALFLMPLTSLVCQYFAEKKDIPRIDGLSPKYLHGSLLIIAIIYLILSYWETRKK